MHQSHLSVDASLDLHILTTPWLLPQPAVVPRFVPSERPEPRSPPAGFSNRERWTAGWQCRLSRAVYKTADSSCDGRTGNDPSAQICVLHGPRTIEVPAMDALAAVRLVQVKLGRVQY